MKEAEVLNRAFGIAGQVLFGEGDRGALVAEVSNDSGSGTIAIPGAQVLSWTPRARNP